MNIVAVRVKPRIERLVKRYDIQWSKELRAYIETRIAQVERCICIPPINLHNQISDRRILK